MRMKKFTVGLLTAVLTLSLGLMTANDVFAKGAGGGGGGGMGGGGRSSFSSSSSRSSPSFSFSNSPRTSSIKPSSGTGGFSFGSSSANKPATGGGFTFGNSGGGTKTPTLPKIAFIGSVNKTFVGKQSSDAYSQFKQDQAKKYNAPNPAPVAENTWRSNPVYNRVRNERVGDGYFDQRRTYYSTRMPQQIYIGYSPSYGFWTGMFLAYLFEHNDAQTFYNHRDDPGYQAYLAEMKAKADAGDAQVKAQLDTLTKQMAAMQASGQKVDPSYLPADVDPAMAVSVDAVASVRPEMRVCTGLSTGNYTRAAKLISDGSQTLDVSIVPTKGGVENLDKLAKGECDAAFVPRDAYWMYADKHPDGSFPFERTIPGMYNEFAHLLCNRASGVKSVRDMGDNVVLYAGEEGSGGVVTWENFIHENSQYLKTKQQYVSGAAAVGRVASANNACMLFVSGLHSQVMETASAQGDKVHLVKVDDSSLGKLKDPAGDKVYSFGKIPGGTYKNIQDGWFFTGVNTVIVPTDFIVAHAWHTKNSANYDSFIAELLAFQPTLQSKFEH